MVALFFSKLSNEEIISRKKYFFHALNNCIYITDSYIDTYNLTKLTSSTNDNIIFIIGHDRSVIKYLKSNFYKYLNKKIVIISCLKKDNKLFIKLAKHNEVYCVKTNANNECYRYKDYFNLGFEPTDEELSLYNIKENIYNKIESIFIKVQGG